MTYVRIYPDCNDSSTYIDSTFEPTYLWYTGKVENKLRNGKWTWFDSTGKTSLIINYKNGVIAMTSNYKQGKIENSSSYEYLNDSLKYVKLYDAKSKSLEEGLMINNLKTDKWVFIDSVTGEKTISNYLPKVICDTTFWEDPNNPGVMTSISCSGVLHGTLIKIDRQGRIILKENYNNGIKE